MEEKEFKIKMAEWLNDLSICFSYDSNPYPEDQIVRMAEMLTRLIIANNMPFEKDIYSNAIRMIASGETEITRLNITGIMKVFRCEYQRLQNKQTERWAER